MVSKDGGIMLDLILKTMEQPLPFGTFHLIFFFAFIVFAILLLIFARKADDKTFRKIVLVCWVIIVVFEIIKEILWGFSSEDRKFHYNWSSFPYQLCSLPFYLWPVTIFVKDCKIRDAINAFIGTYLFFAGFAYFFFPVSFCGYVFINIQTMVHHGMQAVVGLYIFMHEYNKMTVKNMLKALVVLVISVIVAIILNVILFKVSGWYSLNLFELNPINHTTAMVFADILNATNYVIFVIIYILGFTAFAFVFWAIFKYTVKLVNFIKKKN